MAQIEWTDEARKKIREYADYIVAESCSKNIAQKWIDSVIKSVSRLEIFPESGAPYYRFKQLFPEKTRYIVAGAYNVVYKYEKDSDRVGWFTLV
ncbi:MAG: type II toxin-antitoxin system RelE/ParE family toxin [bacterium]|nr:type II toxin-antitoxin system RelE/ParE family toxin [bacterium]